MTTPGHSDDAPLRRRWVKFLMAVVSAYALCTAVLWLVTLVALSKIGSHWRMGDQQLAAALSLVGAVVVMLLPTAGVVTHYFHRTSLSPGLKVPFARSVVVTYVGALLAASLISVGVILAQRDLHRAPTRHQARAEIVAERYLKEHHAAVALPAFERAFEDAGTPHHLRQEVTAALLRRPERARCVAPGYWRTEGAQCFQNYHANQPVRLFIKAPIYVEMRDNAPAGHPPVPEAVAAHVQVQGVFVSPARREN